MHPFTNSIQPIYNLTHRKNCCKCKNASKLTKRQFASYNKCQFWSWIDVQDWMCCGCFESFDCQCDDASMIWCYWKLEYASIAFNSCLNSICFWLQINTMYEKAFIHAYKQQVLQTPLFHFGLGYSYPQRYWIWLQCYDYPLRHLNIKTPRLISCKAFPLAHYYSQILMHVTFTQSNTNLSLVINRRSPLCWI